MVEYRKIEEYPGYRFGNDGSVWTARAKVRSPLPNGFVWFVDESAWRIMSAPPDGDGYPRVGLRTPSGKKKMRRVARLILTAFEGPSPNGMQACHKNGIKTDNRIDNLRWGTCKSNIADKKTHGTQLTGLRHPWSKLTAAKVKEIRARYAAGGLTYRQIAEQYGVSESTVGNVITRVQYAEVM